MSEQRSSARARRRQKAAIAASRSRAEKTADLALELAWRSLPDVLTDDVLAAIESGETGNAQDALLRPSTSSVLPVMRTVQRQAWKAGAGEGVDDVEESFADTPAMRAAIRKAERIEATYRATSSEMRQARKQAKEFLRTFMKGVKDQIAEDLAEGRTKPEPTKSWQAERVALSRLRAGEDTTEARAFRSRVTDRIRSKAATPIADVDWETARRAEVEAIAGSGVVILVEFVATNDDGTTPACQFLDGAKLMSTDARILLYTPGLHFRCRSMFVATQGKRADASWDERISKTIGEPNAGSARQRSYSLRPSQIAIPAGAPNIAPPRSLAEWVG